MSKKTTLIVFIFLIVALFFWRTRPVTYNYTEAIVKKNDSSYVVTLFGRRALMAHDPISCLKRASYKDSIEITFPVKRETINYSEVKAPKTYFKFSDGNLQLEGISLTISLSYIDSYTKKKTEFGWNGTYKLLAK